MKNFKLPHEPTIDELHEAQSLVNEAVDRWLKQHDWKPTSQTPGSRWRWQKKIRGEWFVCSTSTARDIQEHLNLAEELS